MKQIITVPRIIGIVLFVMAALSYRAQLPAAVLLAIAGLVLVFTPADKSRPRLKEFVDSLKPDKNFAVVMLLDLLFWAVFAVILLVAAKAMQEPYNQLKLIKTAEGIALGSIASYNKMIENFFVVAGIAIVITWLFTVLAYSISRGLIWLALLKKAVRKKFFVKFSLLNLAWCTGWLIAAGVLLASTKPGAVIYVFPIILILYAHLTTILHYSYASTLLAKKAVRNAFSTGFGRAGMFLHPYVYIFIVYIILSQALRHTSGMTGRAIAFIIFVTFMAFYRTYLRNVLRGMR